jgi:hypothetical protein
MGTIKHAVMLHLDLTVFLLIINETFLSPIYFLFSQLKQGVGPCGY